MARPFHDRVSRMDTTLILVRHGQTEWNRVERFRGRYDIPLNSTGLEQARRTAQRLAKRWNPVAIYSSPLSRALQTADAIAQAWDLKVMPNEGLIDIDYGAWQGLSPAEARETWPEQIVDWYERPGLAEIPGGETLQQVRDRAMAVVFQAAEQHIGRTVVMVSHTVVNRLILLGALGLGNDHFWRLKQEPCAINVLAIEGQEFTLQLFNDTCHLEDEPA